MISPAIASKSMASSAASGLERLRFAAAGNHYRHAEIEANGDVGTVFRNNGNSVRLTCKHSRSRAFEPSLVLTLNAPDFLPLVRKPSSRHTTRNLALFAVTERQVNVGAFSGRLELGGRLERVAHSPDADTLPSRRFR